MPPSASGQIYSQAASGATCSVYLTASCQPTVPEASEGGSLLQGPEGQFCGRREREGELHGGTLAKLLPHSSPFCPSLSLLLISESNVSQS